MSREEILSNEAVVNRIEREVKDLFSYLGMSKDEARLKIERMSLDDVFDMYLAGEYFLTPLYELLLES